MIYHISTIQEWNVAIDDNTYAPTTFRDEGYIHCSFAHQLESVIDRYYKNEKSVMVLSIDEELLSAELKVERSDSVNDDYPHIYGMINKDAIWNIEVRKLDASNG